MKVLVFAVIAALTGIVLANGIYEFTPMQNPGVARLNKLTGTITICHKQSGQLFCGENW